ncbi:patatin-like phospholipase family protein [Alicyclobacillus tolerans]|uniref:patatin-like phospholipase family protein n=1 Tax=Alicyclobacillus tolerans TaxID=90970 RepID=UPI001EFF8741|nr:patatin-like phospholipase family protein [Alicyclobacillus tolerans]MCF8563736.1 patatin-like phospholipase family protein [Alicyclobacillus tolerans]
MAYRIQRKPRLGIAFSGGTLKAAAHVGVLSALRQLGVRVDCVAGTSAGAFVAALYAHGYTPEELEALVNAFPGVGLFDYGFPMASSMLNLLRQQFYKKNRKKIPQLPSGLLLGKKLEKYFRKSLARRTAKMPFSVVATDLLSGNPVVFSNDPQLIAAKKAVNLTDVPRTVLGSCSLPGILTPVQIGDWLLADGALRHYVPVQTLRQAGCNKIIVVNLARLEQGWAPLTFTDILLRSFEILLEETMSDDLQGDDLFILQPDVSHVTWVSFQEMDECIIAGKKVVAENEKNLRLFLNLSTPPAAGHANF